MPWLDSLTPSASDADGALSFFEETLTASHNITLGQALGRAQWVEAGYAALQLIHAT